MIHELILKFSNRVFIINLEITNFQKRYFKLVASHVKADACEFKMRQRTCESRRYL